MAPVPKIRATSGMSVPTPNVLSRSAVNLTSRPVDEKRRSIATKITIALRATRSSVRRRLRS
jgi:hypothetical protein